MTDVEIMILDKDREVVEQYKDKVASAFIADALKEETIRRVVPSDIDAAIIDLVDKIEVSILVTNYLKKLGLPQIIATAESDEHAEILKLVGATQIIFPNREAARRVAPTLVSDTLFNYLSLEGGLVIAEVSVPQKLVDKSIAEANLRQTYDLNVIAYRPSTHAPYVFVTPDHVVSADEVLLVAGTQEKIDQFTDFHRLEPETSDSATMRQKKKDQSAEFFTRLFGRNR
jgi:trk system potassium uptake protein